VASGRCRDAARASDDLLGAVLHRDGVVGGPKADAPPIAKSDWLRLSWLGFIGYYLASLLDFMGLAYITASERLVLFLYPTMVVLLSAVMRGRPITRRAVVALVVSYAGIAFVFINDLSFAGDKSATLVGGALVFASAFLYALYLIDAGAVIARSAACASSRGRCSCRASSSWATSR
jgi:drug/metabolite transporter (DMT)-like permease